MAWGRPFNARVWQRTGARGRQPRSTLTLAGAGALYRKRAVPPTRGGAGAAAARKRGPQCSAERGSARRSSSCSSPSPPRRRSRLARWREDQGPEGQQGPGTTSLQPPLGRACGLVPAGGVRGWRGSRRGAWYSGPERGTNSLDSARPCRIKSFIRRTTLNGSHL
jgi:hypothetical protein